MIHFKNTLALGALLLLANTTAHAQQKVFYRSNDGKLLTQTQLDSTFAIIQARTKAEGQGRVATLVMKDKTQGKDTTFYTYSINKASQSYVDERMVLQKFVGKQLPAFTLKDINGRLVNSKALVGRPIVINMWFTTCTGCIEEMPELNKLTADPMNKEVIFLSMTYSKKEQVKAFLQKREFNFRAIPDALDYCNLFTKVYPITIFVDKQGIINSIQEGLPGGQLNPAGKHVVLAANKKDYLDASELYNALDKIR